MYAFWIVLLHYCTMCKLNCRKCWLPHYSTQLNSTSNYGAGAFI